MFRKATNEEHFGVALLELSLTKGIAIEKFYHRHNVLWIRLQKPKDCIIKLYRGYRGEYPQYSIEYHEGKKYKNVRERMHNKLCDSGFMKYPS